MIPSRAVLAQALATPAFRGPLGFCSNMHPAQVFGFATVEHAYAAARTVIPTERDLVRRTPNPGDVKRLARSLTLRPGWEAMKLDVVETLVREKFSAHAHLRALLLATGEIELVERNPWRDTFWGVCAGRGDNHLGRILMRVRTELR